MYKEVKIKFEITEGVFSTGSRGVCWVFVAESCSAS